MNILIETFPAQPLDPVQRAWMTNRIGRWSPSADRSARRSPHGCDCQSALPTAPGSAGQRRVSGRSAAGWLLRILFSAVVLAVVVPSAVGRSPSRSRLDFVRYSDPLIELPAEESRFREGALALWLAALESPEADLRQQAQRTLVWAHARGMEGTEAAVEPLMRNLVRDDRLIVRLTAAQALVALDVRGAAQVLFDRSQSDGLDMAQLVEPVLGRWGFAPLIEVWRRRVPDEGVDRRRRLLAIRGLGDLQDADAAEALRQIASAEDQPADLRLAAAAALGQIRSNGLEPVARELFTRQSPRPLVARLVAVRLLRSHDSPETRSLLVEMAADQELTVVANALEYLLELDPSRIVPLAETLLAKGDVNVRRLVARALADCPSAENIGLLAGLLGDPIPSLRDDARKLLEMLAESPEWRAEVIRQGERMADDQRWTVLEQCVILLATLDIASASDRLVEWLSHERPEVYVAAAWGLRRLGVEDTLARALEVARRRNEQRQELLSAQPGQLDVDDQLAHLFEFFGQKRFQAAEEFLRTFVEKDLTVLQSRSAAIWALGYLHEDRPQDELVRALRQRLSDLDELLPEDYQVRRFSAITLGRIKAAAALPTLETFSEPAGIQSDIGYACAWSIERISGRPIPPLPTPVRYHFGFFLEPAGNPR